MYHLIRKLQRTVVGNGRGDVYRDINELCALEGNHSGLHRNFLVGFSIVCEGRRSTLASVLNLLHIRIHLLAPSFASTLGSGWFLGWNFSLSMKYSKSHNIFTYDVIVLLLFFFCYYQ